MFNIAYAGLHCKLSTGVRFNQLCVILFTMDTKKAGAMGALITNKKLTTETRRKAAKKGWRRRKASLAAK